MNKAANNGNTLLFEASSNGKVNMVQCLVHAGADVEKVAKNGKTPLFAASSNGAVDIVKYLIAQGANRNSVDNNGYSSSAHWPHTRVISMLSKCLVNAGADVRIP